MKRIYRREEYFNKIKGFIEDDSMIKVITGIRRCGKSYFLKSIIEYLKEQGVDDQDIISIELDKRKYRNIKKADELEKVIDEKIGEDNHFKYLFLDEIQQVKDFEPLINSYREEENKSIFITGSNSYLLSGELVTKLTGRYVEIEMYPLNFFEYVDMKRFLGKEINTNIYEEFNEYLRNGGFPGALTYETFEDRMRYTENVIHQIWDKDIKTHNKIKDVELFELVQKFIINNFGSVISVKSIYDYLTKKEKIKIDRRTIKRYIDILENSKIIYPCDLFDIKSKKVLKGERKYYLADLSIYYANNTDNRINYGPTLENAMYIYLKSKDYKVSVGYIGKLECDFITRYAFDEYAYLQTSMTIMNSKKTEDREFAPLESISDNYPKYLFTMDMLKQRRNGIIHDNIVDFMYKNSKI